MSNDVIEKPKYKRSQRAYSVANELVDNIRKGKDTNLTRLQMKHGYSYSSANSMNAMRTDTFKEVVAPVIDKMKAIHSKALDNIIERDYTKERLDSVVNVAKQMVHDTQLLQGKATENVATNVVVYGSDDFLATQIKSDVKNIDEV